MPSIDSDAACQPLALWGGLECTVNRVGDDYFSQIERNGHHGRADDVARFSSLGIRAIRYPLLWERMAPGGLAGADWSWADARLGALRDAGIGVIAGLVHHGSGPRDTCLTDPAFAPRLAEYAGAVAARYPWIDAYTPVNEPLTTARFSGLYGLWYPHGRDDRSFLRALLIQCRATVLAMRAIRLINPRARLVQTDDLGKTYSTQDMARCAVFYNERRWLAWDLLCGKVGQAHPLWGYLTDHGAQPAELLWFRDNPCPPDLIGVNYYVTSERWLDHRPERYPAHFRGHADGLPCADIETARVLATPTPGIGPLLQEVWDRYRIPLAVTEAHIDANREDQLRWLLEVWEAGQQARRNGIDLRAVTVWALLGSFDWNSLVTQWRGYYEPGPFDVRSPLPRPTALATMMHELGSGQAPSHPVLRGQGWWRRAGRCLCPPVATPEAPTSITADGHGLVGTACAPILITGATGTLGRAFARICARRNLAYRLLSRQEMDIADPVSVEQAMQRYHPWAVINASGYVRVDEAENDVARCFRDNVAGPAVLAAACARHHVHLTTFSSDLVFDGRQQCPYVESDTVAPINVYGKSKAAAERTVLDLHPAALVVRTSSFFGPWDSYNFLTRALSSLESGAPFAAAADITVTPTYVPDLVHACLDLLIDKERGVWHLTNGHALTWVDLASMAARQAGVDTSRLEAQSSADCRYIAARPAYSALHTERGILLPGLDSAIGRFLQMRGESVELEKAIHCTDTRQQAKAGRRQHAS
ncbi:sugar nucleotide-binding protein [Massilia antarctica]|uniref:sugar nucleotide-binding protein n=1 Tax=Massilia antarctica TaxID=2765360 RepID=UPI0006BB9609|nr:sugar nucleotide-binding protein [Massilia sp. H27-R4]MCY0916160.1 sugar nucleotide-binding protein [Massilia sp. H27-R4]